MQSVIQLITQTGMRAVLADLLRVEVAELLAHGQALGVQEVASAEAAAVVGVVLQTCVNLDLVVVVVAIRWRQFSRRAAPTTTWSAEGGLQAQLEQVAQPEAREAQAQNGMRRTARAAMEGIG